MDDDEDYSNVNWNKIPVCYGFLSPAGSLMVFFDVDRYEVDCRIVGM